MTIDLRGLGSELKANAWTRNLRVSDVVRLAVAAMLETSGAKSELEAEAKRDAAEGAAVKLTIRLRRGVAARLTTRARACGLSQSAYVTTLVDAAPAPPLANVTAIGVSTEQLAVVSADLNELARTIRRSALSSGPLIDDSLRPLMAEVRRHLGLASRLMSELRPGRRRATPQRGQCADHQESIHESRR